MYLFLLLYILKITYDDYDQGHWHLSKVQLVNNQNIFIETYEEYDAGWSYRFQLKRNSLFYKRLFCAPLVGLFTQYLC